MWSWVFWQPNGVRNGIILESLNIDHRSQETVKRIFSMGTVADHALPRKDQTYASITRYVKLAYFRGT